jgi:hypothetical protein
MRILSIVHLIFGDDFKFGLILICDLEIEEPELEI